MPAESLEEWVAARRAELARLFEARLATPANGDPGRLVEAMRYSLLAPGKRIRPLLALAAAEAVGTRDDRVMLASAAVELIHCYSLIHDDLPAMDDDDFRRGLPSNHKVFGDAIAILAGDALLTLAFDWIAEAGQGDGRGDGRGDGKGAATSETARPGDFLRAAGALARGAGVQGMVRGQARDLGEQPPETVAELETLHAEKTAALFRAAVEVGGAAAGAGPEQLAALGRFGTAYGVAFQHADDLADADHSRHAAAAHQRLDSLLAEALAAIAPLGPRATRLEGLARALQRSPKPDIRQA